MIRRPPRSTLDRSSAASDVYKRQAVVDSKTLTTSSTLGALKPDERFPVTLKLAEGKYLSLIHISEPTRPY